MSGRLSRPDGLGIGRPSASDSWPTNSPSYLFRRSRSSGSISKRGGLDFRCGSPCTRATPARRRGRRTLRALTLPASLAALAHVMQALVNSLVSLLLLFHLKPRRRHDLLGPVALFRCRPGRRDPVMRYTARVLSEHRGNGVSAGTWLPGGRPVRGIECLPSPGRARRRATPFHAGARAFLPPTSALADRASPPHGIRRAFPTTR